MIYEIRTYTVKPGKVAEWESRFGEAYEVRSKYSKLGGMWHTELGPLNQVVHMWTYENFQQRTEARAAALQDPSGKWPPPGPNLLVSQEADILTPVDGMTEWDNEAKDWGGLYELRMYTYAPGNLGKVVGAFEDALPARADIYPVAGVFTSELGQLNRLYQLFPFKDWVHRDEVRMEFRKQEVWPPYTDTRPIAQLVRHMTPASFSPLH